MAVTDAVGGFFAAEWARFWQGYAQLSPEQQFQLEQQRAKARAKSGQQNTVSLPGWDQVIHISPAYGPTKAERDEYYAALRAKREPNISPEAQAAILTRRDTAARIASSTTPGYAQAWGQMLTAIDNVQDFTTTVATLGRLALYPAISALDAALPRFAAAGWARAVFGATPEAALAAAQVAARTAAADAYLATRAATLAEYAAAAAAGLERSGLIAAGRLAAEEAASVAARAAFRETLARVGAGFGARTLGRLIPGLGWILLAGDLLNLLAWLGQWGIVGYSGICFGVRPALAGAVLPALMRGMPTQGPCGIKGAVTKLGDLNPFSSTARGVRASKLGRATPTLGNLLETFQTTDQLWGRGISFGAIVGAFTEGAYAAELQSRGESVTVRSPQSLLGTAGVATGVVALQTKSRLLGALAAGSLLLDAVGRTATAPLKVKHQAAQQLQQAPLVNGTQETFTEYQHLEQLVNYYHALELIGSDLRGVPWQDFLVSHLPTELTPPRYLDDLTLAIIRERDPELKTLGRFPMEGAPERITSTELLEWGARTIPRAMRDFLEPRRSEAVGMFAGGMYNLLTGKVWALLEDDPNYLQTRWTPEWRVLVALGETNRVANVGADTDDLWAWWIDSVDLAEQKQLQDISGDDLDRIAAKHRVQLIRAEQPYLRLPMQ